MEYGDGTTLELVYVIAHAKDGDGPFAEDEEDEPIYYLNGRLAVREELPSYITDEDLAKLKHDATEDQDFDFGGPDLGPC